MRSCIVVVAGLVSLLLHPGVSAQSAHIELGQAFLDLGNQAVVMDLSAHPDDEDGATLAYYRMKYGVKTYSLLFTRGEGGQNEKGPELYEELGVIRSEETRRAGTILGTEVVFLNFKDFGYSKTATETIQAWGGQLEVLRRLVYAVRRYKPDVLFTNHTTIDGHGHHQTVAITAIAAFDAAANPAMFPEQLREPGITLWQPRKLFFRAFGRAEGTADVSNAVQETDPLRATGYLDIATQALRQHRTQGMEGANLRPSARGRGLYKLMRANSFYERDSTTFLSGIDLFRDQALAPLRPLRALLSVMHAGMDRDSLLTLAAQGENAIDSLGTCCAKTPLAARILEQWRETLRRITALACGVQVTARLADSVVVAGQRVDCEVRVEAAGCSIRGARWEFRLPPGWTITERKDAVLERTGGGGEVRHFALKAGEKALPTLPAVEMQYASLERRQDVEAALRCTVNGRAVAFSVPVPVEVAPRQTIEVFPPEQAYVRGRTRGPLTIRYRVQNWLPREAEGTVTLDGPAGWKGTTGRFAIAAEDSSATGEITLVPPAQTEPGEYRFRVRTSFSAAVYRLHVFDAGVRPGVRLGIVQSYDTTLQAAARQLDVPAAAVTDSMLTAGDLSRFSTIVVDIRAYLVRPALQSSTIRLLDFMRNGGTVLVMYQRDQEWKPEYAPYPFRITRQRVTMEDAPVTMLLPAHPLLRLPNRIGAEDWEGWKQERGVYFPGEAAPVYERLLACADPDEEPLTTGLLAARVGRGSYIYTSYVWYRQLKEGHSGAFRCFANMISYAAGRE